MKIAIKLELALDPIAAIHLPPTLSSLDYHVTRRSKLRSCIMLVVGPLCGLGFHPYPPLFRFLFRQPPQ